MCPFAYYKKEEVYRPKLYCKAKDNPYSFCMHSKMCMDLDKYIPLDSMEECYIMVQQLKKDIPKDSYFVLFKKQSGGKEFLFIELNEQETIKVENTLGDKVENYVYLKEDKDGYKISLTPFKPIQSQRKKK